VNPIFSKIRDKHALWYKGIVFASCIIICTYLLPKNKAIQTNQISLGQVWLNDDVITSFDFLVKKTNAELTTEKKLLQKQTSYFKHTVISTANFLTSLPADKQKSVTTFIDSAYSVGVYVSLPNTDYQDSVMYLVTNNEVLTKEKKNLISKQYLKDRLTPLLSNDSIVNHLLYILPSNIIYDEALSAQMAQADEETNYIYKSKIKKGTVIVSKNDVVTEEQIAILASYNADLNEQYQQKSTLLLLSGQLLACVLILGIMMLFLAFFRKTIFSQNSQVTFIFLIILLIVFITSSIAKYNSQYIYAVPYCLVPILIRVFFDSRTSLFNFLNIILLCAFFSSDKFEFIFIQLIAGIGTIFSVADMGKRSKLFVSALLAFVFYVLAFVAYHLVNETQQAISNFQNYIPFLISSVCVLFSFPLIYFFEKLFGFTSDFTLLELCDLNSPLLRQLSQKIPGTFQHSLQVANLAEEACYKIGGNALLVRTGAMYHDIGKMNNPRFFTENQVGEVSPHEDLSPEESAQIIIDHVIKGVEIAKTNQLPETVIDFIRTHHGTTTTRYFLHHYKKEHEGEIINEDLFRYPGPIPFSKETAILMMADGVEASSRSLKKYDAVTIDELVDRIINHQINENQFINADITFRDINQIKKIFKKRLMNMYHVRIEYPR
jgi:putative nucleotidyltransferase with HDIG domain